jgi:hypothetical protein
MHILNTLPRTMKFMLVLTWANDVECIEVGLANDSVKVSINQR